MREFLADINLWQEEGKQLAIATVVKVYGSAPRPLASKMAISSAGDMVGSVSGGCVEGAVFEAAQKVMKTGVPQLIEYGIREELAFEVVGLACGGNIEVFIEPLPRIYQTFHSCLVGGRLVALATVLSDSGVGRKLLIWPDGRAQGSLGTSELDKLVREHTAKLLAAQRPERRLFETATERADVFIEVYPPSSRLIIVGAVHIAIHLAAFANELGFRTIVVDPRSVFASTQRFPHVDELIVRWPAEALAELNLDPASYIVFLSHDEKFDNPALEVALSSQAYYIGVLGSRTTHAQRLKALRKMGLADEQLARIHAPIGLDLGARTPEEIAVSIIAEIVAFRRGKV